MNTEAARVLRVDLSQLSTGSGNLNQAFYAPGTYLRVSYALSSQRPTDALALTFFPFDTDRFRLGYLWDLSTIMAGIVWVQYVADANATLLQVDSSGTRQVRIFQSPNQLGFGLTVQARF